MPVPCKSTDATTSWDERRLLVILKDAEKTIDFCVDHFFKIAKEAIEIKGYFAVALSGGSTPKAIFKKLSLLENRAKIDWSRVLVFWSDERSVPPDDPESNFHMAMESGWSEIPVLPGNVFRMKAETEIEQHAKEYEALILTKIPSKQFDLVMLGMGDDGHTASLFPLTDALNNKDDLVAANYVPQKSTWRMTLTFTCINLSSHIALYVIGKSKDQMVLRALKGPYQPDLTPVQQVGTKTHKALWIMDGAASCLIQDALPCSS